MPRGVFAAYALATEDVCTADRHIWQRRRGRHQTSFSYGPPPPGAGYGPPPGGGYGPPPGQAPPPGGAPPGGGDEGDKKEGGATVTWKAKDGEEYELPAESKSKCLDECKNEPWVKRQEEKEAEKAAQEQQAQAQGQQGGGGGVMGALSAAGSAASAAGGDAAMGIGPREMQGDCIRFCQTELSMKCFPGDSTVIVRDRGRMKLADVRVGDSVLSIRRSSGSGNSDKSGLASDSRELFFDEVLTFLHYEVDGKGDVVHIRHALGGLHLTADHLVFVLRRSCSTDSGHAAVAALRAKDVQPGDRVLSSWIDGSITTAEVLAVETVWSECGLFAPLVTSGMLLVDGTLASCYALPESLDHVPAYRCLFETFGGHCLQEVIHCFFLPLRLSCKTTEIMASRATAAASRAAAALALVHAKTVPSVSLKSLALPDEESLEPHWAKDGPIHPYPWFLYVLFSSVWA